MERNIMVSKAIHVYIHGYKWEAHFLTHKHLHLKGVLWDGQWDEGKNTKNNKYNKDYQASSTSSPSHHDRHRANMFFLFNFGLLGLTYYVYNNVGRFRDIICFDDHEEEGGLDFAKNKKNRRSAIKANNRDNRVDDRNTRSVKSEPPWLEELKNIFSSDDRKVTNASNNKKTRNNKKASNNKNSRSAAVALKMREKMDAGRPRTSNYKNRRTMDAEKRPRTRDYKNGNRLTTKLKPAGTKGTLQKRSPDNPLLPANNNLKGKYEESSGKDEMPDFMQPTRRIQSEMNHGSYEPPTLKKSITTKFDKNLADKKGVKVIDRHKKSFHAKKEASGTKNHEKYDTRMTSDTNKSKNRQSRTQAPAAMYAIYET